MCSEGAGSEPTSNVCSNSSVPTEKHQPEERLQITQQTTELDVTIFGRRDSVRITAPVAAQQDVDKIAKTLRKAGAPLTPTKLFRNMSLHFPKSFL